MERQLLSQRSLGREDAAVLCRAVPHGRDQLHVLPDAEREAGGRVGRADAVAVQTHAEGASADHARQATEAGRRSRRRFLRGRRHAGRQARRAALSAAANLKKDLALFDAFLGERPPRLCAAFEFRHASWLDDDVYSRLAARTLALCVADSEKLSTPVRVTADYAYFRLRDEGYTPDDIKQWADRIAADPAPCRDI